MKTVQSEFLDRWIRELSTREVLDPAALKDILARNTPTEEDLAPWTQGDHDPALSYGRCTLWTSERCGIHVMTWNPGDFTALHGHGEADWALMYFLGDMDQRVYDVKGSRVRLQARQKIPGATAFTPDIGAFYHAMGNLGPRPVLTFHVYGSDHHRGSPTEGSRIYEIEKKRIRRSKGPAFLEMAEEFYWNQEVEALDCDSETQRDYFECIRPFFQRIGREDRLKL